MKTPLLKRYLPMALGIAAIIGVWHAVCALGVVNAYVLPSPGRVFSTMSNMISSGEILEDIGVSMGRVLRGFGISFALAFVLGIMRVLVPFTAPYYEYAVNFFRSVPPISMIPLLILWCGIGETTKLVIIVLASFSPMFLSIVKGFNSCDVKLIEVGRTFGYGRVRIFMRIILPHALADILVGMRTGLGYSWRAIIGAEMVAASTGLGHMILFAQQMSRTDKVIVGILVIGVVGYVTDRLFGALIRRALGGRVQNGWD